MHLFGLQLGGLSKLGVERFHLGQRPQSVQRNAVPHVGGRLRHVDPHDLVSVHLSARDEIVDDVEELRRVRVQRHELAPGELSKKILVARVQPLFRNGHFGAPLFETQLSAPKYAHLLFVRVLVLKINAFHEHVARYRVNQLLYFL